MNNASVSDALLLRLWGKTDKDNPLNYHPLLFHLLDVGHVTQRLWHSALSPRLRLHLAQALGTEEPHAQHLVTLLAAQHDLGKASAFQYKDKGLWQRLQQAGLTLPLPKDHPHGFVTTAALPPLAMHGIGGWQAGKAVCQLLAQITGGHHGTFPSLSDWINIGPLTLGGADWDAGRAALLRETARVLGEQEPIPAPLACPLAALTDPALLPLLGGLISVADWIGSSHYFLPAGSLPLDDYVALSRERADKALQAFGWAAVPRFAPPASFEAVFPFPPNPMQQLAAKAAAQTEEPFLMLIEDAMGSGKTEAALYAADISLARESARGLYVALPTQATGNAMFERVKTYLERRNIDGRLNLQLVHAGAALSDAFRALQQAAIYDDVSDSNDVSKTPASAQAQGRAGRIVAEGWFAARKRPLLAPFGVGTIDQSLLGVLQTRHWFVRLLGLAGKVVVLDEVHAYDVYMSRLLARLLQWLRALDCSVVLLSATLPTAARQALVSAWCGTDDAAPSAPYPRLTIARASAPAEALSAAEDISAADPQAAFQDISLAWIGAGWGTVQQRLRADLPQGGCALLLCNTVTRAQEAFQSLRPALAQDGWEIRLFHARTLAAWRQEREHWTLTTFGKDSPQDRRSAKVLLIATQVVEQSLDLDFDWMASEMAPADLLLQRLGRLWRHPGRLRATLTPRFVILCERGMDDLPLFPPYAELIYDRYVLLRSWLALQRYGDALRLPAVIEPLVQATYDAQEPQGLSPAWQQALTTSRAAMQRGQDDDRQTAEANSLPEPGCGLQEILEYGSRLGQVRKRLFDDDDPRVHETVRAATRLGDPSIGVVCTGTDEDGQPLAAPPSGEPTADEARALLRFSIPLSNRRLYHALAAQDPPKAWGGSALLRYQRQLEFTQGQCSLGGYALRLSRAEGLVIEKPNKDEKK